MIDISNWTAVLQGAVHQDTLFHSSIAAMLADYSKPSTGLHGVVPIHYHFLSHWIYGLVARCLSQPIYALYCVLNGSFGVPLFFGTCLGCAEALRPSIGRREFYLRAILLLATMTGFFGYYSGSLFYKYVTGPYYNSESYSLALALLFCLIILLNNANSLKDYGIIFILCCALSLMKVNVGALAWALLGFKILFFSSFTLPKRIGGCGILIFVAYVFTKLTSTPVPGVINKANLFWTFKWTGQAVGNLGEWSFWWSFLKFIVIQNFFGFLMLLSIGIVILTEGIPKGLWVQAIWQWGIASALGLAAVSLLSGVIRTSSLYFPDTARWVALPYLLVFLSSSALEVFPLNRRASGSGKQRDRTKIGGCLGAWLIIGWGVFGTLLHPDPLWASWKAIRTRANEVAALPSGKSAGYVYQLMDIARHPWTRKFAIFIPQSEEDYWTCNIPFATTSFISARFTTTSMMIPALSERAALFGLPSLKRLSWNRVSDIRTLQYGYEEYSNELCRQGEAPHSQDELLGLAKKMNFEGYILVKREGWHAYRVLRTNGKE